MKNSVMFVTEQDQLLGLKDKLAENHSGDLQRGISIFIINHTGEMLLQHRASKNSQRDGVWGNAAKGYTYLGETIEAAAIRLLEEETGMTVELVHEFLFNKLEGISEHKFDHVFVGISDAIPEVDLDSVPDFYHFPVALLAIDIEQHPENYTPGFKLNFQRAVDVYSNLLL